MLSKDPRFKYVNQPSFFWDGDKKEVVELPQNIHDQISANLWASKYKNLQKKVVQTYELNDKFTLEDFFNKFNNHIFVFFLYDKGILWPCRPEDDYLKYSHWNKEIFYPKGVKQIRVYIEEDLKKLRKNKLQKITQNI